ncbi:hypothetical protein RHMOL_Rhmol06G0033900 [Rhododendron molle]|uniref:Uncharacterized protein n=1 Tax=Rhododendron molle TaxID=49168 RepID=A0ACC0NA00_RHOML|nr:hypothetical protein RHMOL_Rhmol06G0033900 [Rhododendron molle]
MANPIATIEHPNPGQTNSLTTPPSLFDSHLSLPDHGPQQSASLFLGVIQILTSWKVDVVFAIFNLICECVSAALEQVTGDRLRYIWAGFASALVAVGFAVEEVLWMKQNKIHMMYCKESTHYLPLPVSKEMHSGKTLFECPICDTPKLSHYVRIPIESLKYASREVGRRVDIVRGP